MKRQLWFTPSRGQVLKAIDPPHKVCVVLGVGRQLRRSSLRGDKSILVRDHTGEYVSVCNAWVPVDWPHCPKCRHLARLVGIRPYPDDTGRTFTCDNNKCANFTLYFYEETQISTAAV